ncbi:MAG: alpha/beta hydrolase [Candidatus Sericytochromatia bacterium]|nr:alpha/beta hydrolase [Candidatus Sericytochromatia bacterium]
MSTRFAHLTGCRKVTVMSVPLLRGTAEVLQLEPTLPTRGYVLALHGFGVNQIFPNAGIYRTFLNAGFGVLAVPLPGHHPAAPPLHSPWLQDYLPTIARHLAPLLDAPISVGYGNSIGAVITLGSLPEIPSIRHGVFLQPPLWVDLSSTELAKEMLTSVSRDLLRSSDFPASAVLSMALSRCRFVDRNGRERLRNFLHPAALPSIQRILDQLNIPERVSRLTDHQMLFITGERDRISPPYDVARLAGYMPCSPQLCVIPKANHTTLFFMPETMQRVQDWLSVHLPATDASALLNSALA